MATDGTSVEELLRQGAERLARGDAQGARESAQQALIQRPNHPLASNLLGLAMLEQRQHAEARDVFETLLRRNPDVVPLRVNAGLAALGAGELDTALDHLRRAVDLDNNHKRAFGYLALAHLRLGEPGFARAALQEAGLAALSDLLGGDQQSGERADAVLRELELGVRTLPAAGATPAPHEGFAEAGVVPPEALAPDPEDSEEAAEAADEIADALDTAFPAERTRHSAPTVEVPVDGPEVTRKMLIPRGDLPTATPEPINVSLPGNVEVRLLDPLLVMRLNTSTSEDGIVLRRDQLVLQQGELGWRGAERRRKGSSDGAFTLPDGGSLQLVEGDGLVGITPAKGQRYFLLKLRQSGLYLRERDLAAFADRLYWENGRLPQAGEGGPSMVALRGSGFVAVLGRGRLFKVPTADREVLTVDFDRVLGWSPNTVPVKVEQTETGQLLVGFSGAGVVWLDLPQR
jgi:tetratricopeptide (TPR) repeat protein